MAVADIPNCGATECSPDEPCCPACESLEFCHLEWVITQVDGLTDLERNRADPPNRVIGTRS